MSAIKMFDSWESAVKWLRTQPDQMKLVFDAYFDDPVNEAAERYFRSPEWKEVKTILPQKKGKAVDVGAGRGIASYALVKEGYDVIALEPNKSEIVGTGAIHELANKSRIKIEIKNESSEKITIKDNEIDLIFGRAVIHHMIDIKRAMKELARILKPGGKLIFIREHVISKREDLRAFLEKHPLHKYYGGENAYLLSEYIDAISSSNLKIDKVLLPLESVINYYPHTLDTLRREIIHRLPLHAPCRSLYLKMLSPIPIFNVFLKAAALFDKRPGRLYSFICTKLN